MLTPLHDAAGSTRMIHLNGWKKQSPDERDHAFALKLHGIVSVPPSADNRNVCSPISDQGPLGACTAHMFAALVESNEIRRLSQKKTRAKKSKTSESSGFAADGSYSGTAYVEVSAPRVLEDGSLTATSKIVLPPGSFNADLGLGATGLAPAPSKIVRASRLFEYYGTRKIEGTVGEDSGASIRDAIKCGALYGVADEAQYAYDIAKFKANPPAAVWKSAATRKVTSYHAIADGDVRTMKSVLASGYLIGFGFAVYDYMMSEQMAVCGVLNVPTKKEKLLGGHAVALVGYHTAKKLFLVRNSWGLGWGQNGYFWMSEAYVGNPRLSNDFWVVQSSPL